MEVLRKMRKDYYDNISGSKFEPGTILTFLTEWVLSKSKTFQSPSAVVDLAGIFSCCVAVWWSKFLCEWRREQTEPEDEEERSLVGSPEVGNLKLINVHNREASLFCGRRLVLWH
jgi:hypothetical protein